MKYKIKGKIYKFIEECEVVDHEFVIFKKIIEKCLLDGGILLLH